MDCIIRKRIEGSTHYLGNKTEFDILRERPSSGITLLSANFRRRAFARNVEFSLIALAVILVSRSICHQ